mmetsp:Transcript_20735/g.28969  ORF Transcript_20735/g.28969 Transcript_20735/m.28969 type:complete len:415 (+) Transcript_20735:89-1333(+)|eukprot:CAMPEP_0184483590 /NCGR_PEP_ID=MMETSP0113_2-20130426/5273_1 /TAXON_ID=91329 /ORGANISM="Norrisiella sphaerica, Strain BC52" /LENGTH=414 /DNA_ID=CAMNT_0026864113 /DNA_START=211 /DNA_END=1455 /DNA_ORIENTATION=-
MKAMECHVSLLSSGGNDDTVHGKRRGKLRRPSLRSIRCAFSSCTIASCSGNFASALIFILVLQFFLLLHVSEQNGFFCTTFDLGSSGISHYDKYRAQEAIKKVNNELSTGDKVNNIQDDKMSALDLVSQTFSQQIATVKMDPEVLKRASAAAERINDRLQRRGVTGAGTPMPFMQYRHEIDINDVPEDRRAHLGMTATHMRINKETGSVVSILGRYMPPEEDTTGVDKRLRICVTATTEEMLDAGVNMVYKLINDGNSYTWAPGGGLPFSAKVVVDVPNAPGFNLKHRVIGPMGGFMKHIEDRAGIRVFLRGRGSGFIEGALGHEMEEPMFLYLAAPNRDSLEVGRVLAEDLVKTIADDFVHYAQGNRHGVRKDSDLESGFQRQDSEMMTKLYGEQLYALDALAPLDTNPMQNP